MSIDLHIHSYYSDGTFSPYELLARSKKKGLTAVSITDHDTIAGIDEGILAGDEFGIELIPGIELSVVHKNSNLHILGYYIDHNSSVLQHKLETLQIAREERNKKIINKLQSLGVDIHYREVKNISRYGQMGRPHIARILCKKNIVKNMDEAFEKYLKRGAGAYVSRFIYSAVEAINMVKQNGGFAVLAHPVQVDYSMENISSLIGELVEIGLDGVEVYYPTHSKVMRKRLKKITEQFDLVSTGGSDYHGLTRPGTDLAGGHNFFVPRDILDKMKQKWIMKI